MSPALAGRFFITEPPGQPHFLSLKAVALVVMVYYKGRIMMKISQRRESEGVRNAELLLVCPYGVRTWYPPGTDLGKHAWNTASQERSPQLKYPLPLLGLHSVVLTDHLISTWFNSLSRASGTCYSNLTPVPIIWLVFLLWLASNLRLASMARPCPKSKDISVRYDIDYLPQTQCKDQIYFLGCVCVCACVCMCTCSVVSNSLQLHEL